MGLKDQREGSGEEGVVTLQVARDYGSRGEEVKLPWKRGGGDKNQMGDVTAAQ